MVQRFDQQACQPPIVHAVLPSCYRQSNIAGDDVEHGRRASAQIGAPGPVCHFSLHPSQGLEKCIVEGPLRVDTALKAGGAHNHIGGDELDDRGDLLREGELIIVKRPALIEPRDRAGAAAPHGLVRGGCPFALVIPALVHSGAFDAQGALGGRCLWVTCLPISQNGTAASLALLLELARGAALCPLGL